MTPDQEEACQADIDTVIREYPGAVGKVRYAPLWVAEDGEVFDGYWYAEIRRGDGVLSLDCDVHAYYPETWREVLRLNMDGMAP